MNYLKTIIATLLLITVISCSSRNSNLSVTYLKEGQLTTEVIPLDFIDEGGAIVSPYINSVSFAYLDSVVYLNNHPDSDQIFSTAVKLDFKKPIKQYSPEYYSAYAIHNIIKAVEYYNRLFDNRIDFNSQTDDRDVEFMFGDIPLFSSPKSYIIEEKSNPSPSLFFHEVGHRAFWYIQDKNGLDVKFKGLSYVHMGLLEYFTVSLNDSPVVGEGFLPLKMLRNASWIYPYPIPDSLTIGKLMLLIEESYPDKMENPQSNIHKYCRATNETYKDYFYFIDNHKGGMVITGTLWRIREHLGQGITDQLISQTILNLNEYMDARQEFYFPDTEEQLPNKIEWYDLYYGLLQKDRELNGGKGEGIIKANFEKTGFPTHKIRKS